MLKKILIAEKSDTIRQITETILRQNNYEVISVISGQHLLSMYDSYYPDMIIASSDLYADDHTPVYQIINNSEKFSSIPFLILISADEPQLPLPDDYVLTKPFDPKELLELVKGRFEPGNVSMASIPEANTDTKEAAAEGSTDAMLDMALGIDSLEVTDSEVMDSGSKAPARKTKATDEDSGRVESLMIRDEQGEIDHIDHNQKPKSDDLSASDSVGLELMNDQYGMEHGSPRPDLDSPTKSSHDYDWFLNELKTENQKSEPTDPNQNILPPISEAEELDFSDTSTFVDPITPSQKEAALKVSSSDSVDNFIDDFKKEVEKISSDLTETVTISKAATSAKPEKKETARIETKESNEPNLEMLKKQFVGALAEKIAKKIADNIDSDKLVELLKQELADRNNK